MFSFFSKKDKSPSEPPEQYINLRNSILMSSAGQFNIQSSGKNPDVWGVLIDENFGKHIQSVWATASGHCDTRDNYYIIYSSQGHVFSLLQSNLQCL